MVFNLLLLRHKTLPHDDRNPIPSNLLTYLTLSSSPPILNEVMQRGDKIYQSQLPHFHDWKVV